MSSFPITLIAAVARNGVIGRNNAMIWHIRSEFAHLRASTMGKPVIMGRKTFESIGKALPGRLNIIISRTAGASFPGAVSVASLEAALAVAHGACLRSGAPEIMILGGASIYAATMPLADRLLISRIEAEPEGDAFFPPIDSGQWALHSEKRVEKASDKDDYDFTILDYHRIR